MGHLTKSWVAQHAGLVGLGGKHLSQRRKVTDIIPT